MSSRTPRKRATPSTTPAAPRNAGLSVDRIIDELIEREGGFVDDPLDRGGATNMGITHRTLSQWLGRRASTEDVRALTRGEAAAIYRQRFWSGPGYDRLDVDQRVAVNAFDAGVMSGERRGIRFLQTALRELGGVLAIDGAVGPETNRVARQVQDRVGIVALNNALCDVRQAFYDRIVANDPSQARFQRGWRNRVNRFRMTGEVEEIRNIPGARVDNRPPPPAPDPNDDIRNAGRALPPPPPPEPARTDPVVVGGAATGGLAVLSTAQQVLDVATRPETAVAASAFPWLQIVLPLAVVVCAGLVAYGYLRYRRSVNDARREAEQEL